MTRGSAGARVSGAAPFALAAALSVASVSGGLSALAAPDTPAASQPATSEDAVKILALKWFADMQSGRIDRAQLAPAYNAQLTDDAVKSLAKYMQDHAYGAQPRGAEIVKTRKTADQSIYIVKIVFPRGDAASLMIGLDNAGEITGIDIMSMAGD